MSKGNCFEKGGGQGVATGRGRRIGLSEKWLRENCGVWGRLSRARALATHMTNGRAAQRGMGRRRKFDTYKKRRQTSRRKEVVELHIVVPRFGSSSRRWDTPYLRQWYRQLWRYSGGTACTARQVAESPRLRLRPLLLECRRDLFACSNLNACHSAMCTSARRARAVAQCSKWSCCENCSHKRCPAINCSWQCA